MAIFTAKKRNKKLARGVYTVRKGIGFLQAGDFESASREFRRVVASNSPKTSGLVRSVASFYAYNTARLRKESKKIHFGNAHLMEASAGNGGDAWSDVDIAAVLIAPTNHFTTRFLAQFLGRSEEAVRFQRRYAFGAPLPSWVDEKGNKYTRFTQTQRVSSKLGV
jgi:hypothetical protein